MTDIKVPGLHHPITIEQTPGRVTVRLGGQVVVDTSRALTLREASYPPVQYVPLEDVDASVLEPSSHTSWCPYKGTASYYDVRIGDRVFQDALWAYPSPHEAVSEITGHAAFYADRVDEIEVHDA
jgi:uncharacterized protein (DUF427 family)